MSYSIEFIASALKAARKNKKLSQRALSEKVGVPQSHISKIENGSVDLKLTSLTELSRALDLELMLVPRQLIPVVQGIIRSTETATGKSSQQPDDVYASTPAYRLDDEDENDG